MKRWLAALFVALTSSGCTTPPALDTVHGALASTRWRTHPEGHGAPAGQAQWWRQFGDSLLDQLVEQALANNAQVATVTARVSEARSLARAAGGALWPSLDGRLVVNAERGTQQRYAEVTPLRGGSTATYEAVLAASWEVPLFGRAAASASGAAAAQVARADADATRLLVAAEVILAYNDWRAAAARGVLLAAGVKSAAQAVRLVSARYQAGLDSASEPDRAESTLTSLRQQQAANALALSMARERLVVLLADDSSLGRLADAPAANLPEAPALTGLPADVVRARPDVVRAEARVLQAAAEREVALSELWPRLTLTGSIGFIGPVLGNTVSGRVRVASGTPAIDIPLLDWGARRARADAGEAALQAAIAEYREAVLRAVEEVQVALARQHSERAAYLAADQRSKVEAAIAGRVKLLFDAGMASDIDVRASELAALQRALERIDALRAAQAAVVGLHRAAARVAWGLT